MMQGHRQDGIDVAAVLSGDHNRFEQLVRRHQHRVYAIAAAMLWQRHHLDDVVQETFVNAFTKLEQFDPQQDFARWLKQIARNVAIDHIRLHQRERSQVQRLRQEIGYFFSRTSEHPRDPDDDELMAALRVCRDELPDRSREVIEAFYAHNLDAQSISRQMGLATGAVHQVLSRARRALRRCLQVRMRTRR